MAPSIDPYKIVVFTGAGISAESGIATYRGADGTWNDVDPMKVASAAAWIADPETVLDFHNRRLAVIKSARPNAAHHAIARLQEQFDVTVITQNVDDLHERSGSAKVLHLHGSALEVSTQAPSESVAPVRRGFIPLRLGDTDATGRQLRPRVVWFGENVLHYREAEKHLSSAGRVLAVGTSLTVFPAAGLLTCAKNRSEKVIVAHEVESLPDGFRMLRGDATEHVPSITERWIKEGPARLGDAAGPS